jgi:surface antigen
MLKTGLSLALILVVLSYPAHALVLWYSALPPLTEDDLKAILVAGEGLEKTDPGTTRSWKNEKNGHSGTLTLVKTYKEQGKNCRIIRHRIRAGFDKPWVEIVHTCQDEQGRWMLDQQKQGK